MNIISTKTEISDRISLLRIILICGIVVIHIPHGTRSTPYGDHFSAFNWLRILLADVIFRAGVPCLSAISGYLLFRNGTLPSYQSLVAKKLTTLALPLLFWNGLLYAAVYFLQGYEVAVGYFPDLRNATPRESIDLLLAVSAEPINLPLYFLRDLLVCMMLAPAVATAVRAAPLPTLLMFFIASISSTSLPLLLRTDILFSFALGAALAIHRINVTAFDGHRMHLMAAFLVLSCALAFVLAVPDLRGEQVVQVGKKALPLIGMLGFWSWASWMTTTTMGAMAVRASRCSFWIFCTHYPVMAVLWMVRKKYFNDIDYAWYYLVALITTVPTLMLFHSLMEPRLGAFFRLINGGR